MKLSSWILCLSTLSSVVLADGKCCCKPPTTVTVTEKPDTVTVTVCPEKATQAAASVCSGTNCHHSHSTPLCTDPNKCHPTSEQDVTSTTRITNTVTVYPTQDTVTSPCPTCKKVYTNSTQPAVPPTNAAVSPSSQAPVSSPLISSQGKYVNATVAVVKTSITKVVTETQTVPCTDATGGPSSSHKIITRTTTVCPEEETA